MKKKTWFQLMWSNFYIQLFALALLFLVYTIRERETFYTTWGFYIALGLPILMMAIIGYSGFYRVWKNYKNLP